MQVVWAGPHVGEDQRPEVHDRQAIAVDRAFGLLGDGSTSSPGSRRSGKAHRVVAVPPLHHGVLYPGIDRVGLHEPGRNGRAVDQVQQGHGDDEGAKNQLAT